MTEYKPLTIKRTIHASRQVIWDAWTQPEQFKKWYMPAPFSVRSCELDVQPGGKLKVETLSPDGVVMPLVGEFTVVDEPNKLVMTNSPLDENGNKLFVVQHTLILTEAGDDTVLEVTSEVLSAGPNAEQFLSGMEQGLNQALDQMATLVTEAN